MATLVAWNVATNEVKADVGGDSSSFNLWRVKYRWQSADVQEVPGTWDDDVAEKLDEAIEARHTRAPGQEVELVKMPGGIPVNPFKYGAVTASLNGDNPKVTYIPPRGPKLLVSGVLNLKWNMCMLKSAESKRSIR